MRETIYLVRSTIYLMVLLFLGACSHPLDEPWLDKKSPKSHSISRLNCERCHDLTIECNACHFGSSGSKTPSDWIHGMTPHGDLVASGPVCNTCHTLTRIYGNGPASCHDCHSLPAFMSPGRPGLIRRALIFTATAHLPVLVAMILALSVWSVTLTPLGANPPRTGPTGMIPITICQPVGQYATAATH